jgi:twitching motility protein PilT
MPPREFRRPAELPVAPAPSTLPPPPATEAPSPFAATGRLGPTPPSAQTTTISPGKLTLPVLLHAAVQKGASDLHLSATIPPTLRMDGFLQPLPFPPLAADDCRRLVYSVMTDDQKTKYETNWELDFSLEIEKTGRFRVNVHRQRGSTEAAFRVVNDVIQPIRRLGLPPVVEELARRDSGLVLVTGPTGSGKTTSLAAMVDLINSERQCMIVTIEDPIEYVHANKRSIVKQREVTSDTKSFGAALRHVLRQDPDVIVIGEMRDLETISTALTAAETGHLELATLHTPDAMQTIDRVIDVFPPHQQQQVRIQLANSLEGIISQQLLPIPGAKGRVVAVEILVSTTAIRKIIRVAKTEQITSTIQTSWELGMITMDKSLKNLYAQGLITYDDAISKCRYPENFDQI